MQKIVENIFYTLFINFFLGCEDFLIRNENIVMFFIHKNVWGVPHMELAAFLSIEELTNG